jgi:anti-sigma factor RsiW
MTDQWTDRLSDYLDDELTPGERAEIEAHLLHCVACGAVLADLRRIVTRAQGLDDRMPERDLWPGIAARIGAGQGQVVPIAVARGGRRWTFSPPELAAAAIALMALSGGAVWLLHPAPPAAVAARVVTPATIPSDASPALGVAAAPRRTGRGYDAAVADLEAVLAAGRSRLDTTTVRVIERNLATIDSAIAQARHAVAADSANLYLNTHLADTRRRKLELLRQAAALVSSVS